MGRLEAGESEDADRIGLEEEGKFVDVAIPCSSIDPTFRSHHLSTCL